MSSTGMGRDVFCLILSIQLAFFSLPTTASPTIQGARKDGFGEAVMARDIGEPCKFSSLHCCQERFLWIHKEVDLAPHPVVGLVLQVGDDAEKFPQALGFEILDPFCLRVSKQGPCFTAVVEDGSDKRFVQFELACKADGVAPPHPA